MESTPQQQDTSSRSSVPLNPSSSTTATSSSSAPLKLTFRLGGGGASNSTGSSSSNSNTTTISSLISAVPSYAAGSSIPGGSSASTTSSSSSSSAAPRLQPVTLGTLPSSLNRADSNAPTASSSRSSSVSAVPMPGDAPPKKKQRKPAVKRAPGEVGPGKHWRKGMKGTIVAGQPLPYIAPRAIHSSNAPSPDSSAAVEFTLPRVTFPIAPSMPGGGPSKVSGVAPFLPAQPLEPKTPATRKWSRGVLAIKSIRGSGWLKFTTWEGDQNSAYADYKVSLLPPPPPPPQQQQQEQGQEPQSSFSKPDVLGGLGNVPSSEMTNDSSASPSVGPLSPVVQLLQPSLQPGVEHSKLLKEEEDGMRDTVMMSV